MLTSCCNLKSGRGPEKSAVQMLNETLKKFGYPESLIATHGRWHVLLRPDQVTLGSLVLICNEPVGSLGEISAQASAELREVAGGIERVLGACLGQDKLNYLALMMVDPEVHFHVLPRYSSPMEFGGKTWADPSWPGPADITSRLELDQTVRALLSEQLSEQWSQDSNIQERRVRKYSRLYTSGCFDIFHHGHLNIIQQSRELCDHLIVGVSTDELIEQEKGRAPLIPYRERASVITALSLVDEVIPQADKNKQSVVDQYSIDAISVGSDWKGRYPKVSCAMEYFEYTPNVSSTALKNSLGASFSRQ
jgi:glycerol-3-phosphate cytidylyltransferase